MKEGKLAEQRGKKVEICCEAQGRQGKPRKRTFYADSRIKEYTMPLAKHFKPLTGTYFRRSPFTEKAICE